MKALLQFLFTPTVLRSILKIGGGAMAAKGLADDSTAEAIAAGLTALLGVVWGLFDRKPPTGGVPVEVPIKRSAAPLLALAAVALLTPGCVGTAGLVRALAKDPAAVSAEVITPWGHMRVTRVGPNTNSLAITAAGADVNTK